MSVRFSNLAVWRSWMMCSIWNIFFCVFLQLISSILISGLQFLSSYGLGRLESQSDLLENISLEAHLYHIELAFQSYQSNFSHIDAGAQLNGLKILKSWQYLHISWNLQSLTTNSEISRFTKRHLSMANLPPMTLKQERLTLKHWTSLYLRFEVVFVWLQS